MPNAHEIGDKVEKNWNQKPAQVDAYEEGPVKDRSNNEGLNVGTAISLVGVDTNWRGSPQAQKQDNPGVLGRGVAHALFFPKVHLLI